LITHFLCHTLSTETVPIVLFIKTSLTINYSNLKKDVGKNATYTTAAADFLSLSISNPDTCKLARVVRRGVASLLKEKNLHAAYLEAMLTDLSLFQVIMRRWWERERKWERERDRMRAAARCGHRRERQLYGVRELGIP